MKTIKKILRHKKTMLFIIALLVFIMVAGSCKDASKQKEDEVTREDVTEKVEEASETTKAYLIEERENILDEYEAQITKAEEQIETLKQKAVSANENVKVKYQKTINSLEKQKIETKEQIEDLKESSEAAWEEIKEGVDKSFSELDQALQDAKNEFK